MNVLVVLSALFTGHGGIPRFNRILCRSLDELAIEFGLEGSVVSLHDDAESYRRHGPPWRRLRFTAGGGKYRTLLRTVSMCARERPDLLLLGHIGMTPAGLLCAPFLRGGYGFIAHGTEVWSVPRWTRRTAARRATVAFAVSHDTGESLIDSTGVARRRLRYLPNALDPALDPDVDDSNERSDPRKGEILSVARLWASQRRKGVDTMLRAFARVAPRYPRLRYRVVGKGDDKERLVSLAVSLGIGDRVVFEEDLSDPQLVERYRRCSIFALPSGQEGFGIVFLEAMRFAKPCIGGTSGGTADVVIDGRTGLLVPFGDVDALEAALLKLLTDRTLREELGRNGRTHLDREYTFAAYKDRLRAHLTEWLGDRSPVRSLSLTPVRTGIAPPQTASSGRRQSERG